MGALGRVRPDAELRDRGPDGSKAETGVSAELGGRLGYLYTKLGLGIEARVRYLLACQKSAFEEWGAKASQVEQIWDSADVLRTNNETAGTLGMPLEQVASDIGYGSVTHEGTGLLTVYGGVSMAGRIELGEWLDLSMEGERTMQGDGAAPVVPPPPSWRLFLSSFPQCLELTR